MSPRGLIAPALALLAASACSSFSARSRIVDGLVELGVGSGRARCLAGELSEDLGRRDMNALADFIGGLNREESAGRALDAILRIDDPRVAAAIAAAAVSCALR